MRSRGRFRAVTDRPIAAKQDNKRHAGGTASGGRGRIGQRSIPAPAGTARSLGRRDAAVGEDVKDALAAGEKIVGDDPTMAAPPYRLRAHDRAAPAAAQFGEPGETRSERAAFGIVGVIVEAAVLPQCVAPRRNIRLAAAPSAQFANVLVADTEL